MLSSNRGSIMLIVFALAAPVARATDVVAALSQLKTLSADIEEDVQGWTLETQSDGSDLRREDAKDHRKMKLTYDGQSWRLEAPDHSKDTNGKKVLGFYRETWNGKHWTSYTHRSMLESKGGTGALFDQPVPRFHPLSFGYQIQGQPIRDLIRKGALKRRANLLEGRVAEKTVRIELDPAHDDYPRLIALESPSEGGRTFEEFQTRGLEKSNGAWIPKEGDYKYRIVANDGVQVKEISANVSFLNPVANGKVGPIDSRLPKNYRFTGRDDEVLGRGAEGDPVHVGWIPGHVKPLAWVVTLSLSSLLWTPVFLLMRRRGEIFRV